MLAPTQNKAVYFNDGRLRGLLIDDETEAITGQTDYVIPCGLPTVGFRRFYEAARTEGLGIDLVATIPWIPALFDYELVELERNDYPGKTIYKIIQTQERKDAAPPCFQLSLQKVKVGYEDHRTG